MSKELLLGNAAIGRGLVENGCHVVTSYPGTPSSEILPAVVKFKKMLGLDIYTEWSLNEKVAFEVALGASYTGKRAAVIMKQVGLNVAADPLMSSAYTGVPGGFLVISADDPGPHSSQTEQDTRFFAMFAKVPVFDPASPQEAKDMIGYAFELSEKYETPVILRPAIRVCHAFQNVEVKKPQVIVRKPEFKRNPQRWAATPRYRLILHRELNSKLEKIAREFEESEHLNYTINADGKGKLGIIAGGVCYSNICDILSLFGISIPVLKIGTPYPFPAKTVSCFIERYETIVVIEETDSVIEMQIRDKSKTKGRHDGVIPNAGELTPEAIYNLLLPILKQNKVLKKTSISIANPFADEVKKHEPPARKPILCAGCPHRSSFYAIKKTFKKGIFPSDIGCYTLGIEQRAVDTVLDMGASINIATGLYHAYNQDKVEQPIISTIGDSTFLHSGLPALADAVYTNARYILVVLDNSITAMTGMQPTADSGILADGSLGKKVSIKDAILGLSVEFYREVDPYNIDEMIRILEEAYEFNRREDGGMAVIHAKHPCIIFNKAYTKRSNAEFIITGHCEGCRRCITTFGCPALYYVPEENKVRTDLMLCIECGECRIICPNYNEA
ncbi:indolepyruvate ferredoxin oxidoreductase subunit alpha [bacterium]|nr:indolepyruvate ferredoxin oxidoreductase subunit alpha [bacterium]